jgi:hypothetical protein
MKVSDRGVVDNFWIHLPSAIWQNWEWREWKRPDTIKQT